MESINGPCMIMSSNKYDNNSTTGNAAVPTATTAHVGLHVDTAAAGAAAAGPAAAHSDSSSAAAGPPPSTTAQVANVKWADAHLGRGAALTANGVYTAAGATTELVGWTVGDPKLRVRSGLRSLAPMHLRVSARIHHVAFYHPALDADDAVPPSHSGGGGGSDVSSGTGVGKVLGGMRNMVGLDGRSGTEWAAEDAARLAAVVESESYRLSRDGIVEHHFARQAAGSRRSRSSRKGKTVTSPTAAAASTSPSVASADAGAGMGKGTGPTKSATVNARRFVFASRIPQSAETTKRSAVEQPEAILRHVLKKEKDKSGENDFSSASAIAASSIMAGTSKADQMPHTVSVVYDEDGITGDGPMLAALIKATSVAKIGRYLPEVACRVPLSSVFFELRGEGRHARSTQREYHVQCNAWAHMTRTSNRMVCVYKVVSYCSLLFFLLVLSFLLSSCSLKALTNYSLTVFFLHCHVPAFVVEAPHVIFGGGRDRLIQSVAADGNPLVDARKFEYLSNNELSMSERTESLLCAGATVWVDVAKAPKKNTKTAADVAKGLAKTVDKSGHAIARSVEKAATKTAHAGNKGAKGMKKVFRISPMRPKKNKGKKEGDESEHATARATGVAAAQVHDGNGDDKTEGTRPILEGSPDGKLQAENPQEEHDAEAEEGSTGMSMAGTETVSILPSAPLPYQLVLDDVLDFRVCEFPSANIIATFPISISSVLNNREMEDRLNNPRHPSELTITLVQEPSVKDKRWGVEAKITFRVVEVQPDTPLAIEKPEQDDKGRWTKSSLEDRMKRMRVHLRNIGRPKDQIENEIKAIEEKEMAEEEERESAIVSAGIGKGYEQGAPRKEIIRRQMFYDPERELFTRRKRRTYASGDLNSGLLKQVALHSAPPGGGDLHKTKPLSKIPILDVKIPSEILTHDTDQNIMTLNDDKQPDERTTYDTGRPMSIQEMRETFVSARDLAATSIEDDADDRDKKEEDGIDESVVDDPASEGELFVSTKVRMDVMAHGASNELSTGKVDGEDRSLLESAQGHVAQKDANPVLGPKSLERVRFAEDSISHLSSTGGGSSGGENPGSTKQYKATSTVEQYSRIDANNTINAEVPAPSPITPTLLGTGMKNDSIAASLELQSSSSIRESDNNTLEAEGQTRLSDESSSNLVEPPTPTRYGRETLSSNDRVSESVQTSAEVNTEGKEEEQLRNERRERKRRSIQSMALMHLSFGGAKNLVEGDELDMLYQMKENCDNDVHEDKDKEPPKSSSSCSGDIGVAKGGQPPEVGASYRDAGKRVLLEEYPGALILLCLVIFIVFTKMSVSFLLNAGPKAYT